MANGNNEEKIINDAAGKTEPAQQPAASQTETPLEGKAESAKAAEEDFCKVKAQAEEFKGLAQRIQADFDNYRKRNNESVKQSRADGVSDVVAALLPVADSVDRALAFIIDEKSREGVGLIARQLDTLFAKFGISEIKAQGEAFDPELHNAIMQTEDEKNAGKVVEVLQKGYIRDGKIIRHAMVKVAK